MNLSDAKQLLAAARPSFYKHPEPVRTYIHWTGGDHNQVSGAYHFCITGNGDIVLTRDLRQTPAATYMRNTGSIAISMCAASDAVCYGDHSDLGPNPPTGMQIETCAALMAAIADIFDIPIDITHFMTHAEAADNKDGWEPCEAYGPENGCDRWDLYVTKETDTPGDGGNILRSKAIWYQYHK